jgi:hypothetical protein
LNTNIACPVSLVLEQITRTISAHEQHPIGSWLSTFPKKVSDSTIDFPFYVMELTISLRTFFAVFVRLLSVPLLTSYGLVEQLYLLTEALGLLRV